jgi:hypothetical protein
MTIEGGSNFNNIDFPLYLMVGDTAWAMTLGNAIALTRAAKFIARRVPPKTPHFLFNVAVNVDLPRQNGGFEIEVASTVLLHLFHQKNTETFAVWPPFLLSAGGASLVWR